MGMPLCPLSGTRHGMAAAAVLLWAGIACAQQPGADGAPSSRASPPTQDQTGPASLDAHTIPDQPEAAEGTPAAPGDADTPVKASSTGESVDDAICRLIEEAALKEGLPASFFTRLIWRESSFRAHVVSHAGAQGIAQFMPGTARERGLENPFDPQAAIPASAKLLADLGRQFGNLGLAAAAYNAGPGRVSGFLAGGTLPGETRRYVEFITGRSAQDWAALKRQGGDAPAFPQDGCLKTVASLRKGAPPPAAGEINELFAPWGVQISGNYVRDIALASFRRAAAKYPAVFADHRPVIIATRVGGRGYRVFYRVRLPAQTRAEANQICARLRKAGGSCLALPN